MSDGSSKAVLGGLRFAKVLVWLVYAYFTVAVVVLVLAFFLLLFAANPDADFTQWVYRAADRALAPFWGIFPSVEGESGSVLDFAVVFAIIMYGILAMAVHALVEWLDTKVYEAKRRRALAAAGTAPPAYGSYAQGAPGPLGTAPTPQPQTPTAQSPTAQSPTAQSPPPPR